MNGRSPWFVAIAAILALPCGYFMGVTVAALIAGRDVGVLPALTIFPCWGVSFAVAFSRKLPPATRAAINAVGTATFILLTDALL